jgi:molybdopterin-containing oxidoreductase family membrane subunit
MTTVPLKQPNGFLQQAWRLRFWLWCALLGVIVVIGLHVGIRVLTEGLGITNLSDLAPWGLWIVVDLSCIALSAGAFSLSALAHLFGRADFKPIARVAVFVGLLGYTGALCCLLLDIGRPDRFWHGWVYWQVHSMLWEVTMCITLYFLVLLLEVLPMVLEMPIFARFKALSNFGKRIHRFAPILAVLGMGLSLLHQSSLGGTYGVVAGRAFLYRATMPLLFIVSAVAAGMAFTVQMTLITQWLKGRILVPRRVLFTVGQFAGGVLLVYLYMRFWDSTAGAYGYVPGRTEADQLLSTGLFGLTFWGWEIILGGLVAAILLIMAGRRQSIGMLMMGCGLTMAGVIANRWNTTMLAFTQPLSTDPVLTIPEVTRYTPNHIEWLAAIGIVAGLTLAFSLGMRFLPAYRGVAPLPLAATAQGMETDEAQTNEH